MKRDIKNQWIEALVSGKYDQGETSLCSQGSQDGAPKRWCCLGVLADILDPEGWERQDKAFHEERLTHPLKAVGSEYLTFEALEKAGMTDGEQRGLATLNDEGVTFSVIARTISQML